MPKRWVLKQPDEGNVSRHVEAFKISPLLARLLVLRGLADSESTKRYLSASLRSDLPSPFLMAGMEAAVHRLMYAVQHSERICIWGDYDVDGTTGAALMVCFLRQIGAEPLFYVPHRIDEGYGLNIDGLRRLKEKGVTLVVCVDCGISSAQEIDAARLMGLDVIVVDHHQPPNELPRAVAIINPHRHDCWFPDKGMCAAGLAFYLIIGLRAKLREAGWFVTSGDPDLRHYLDIVTLGTIADMVPLKGVNRTLIRRGLAELRSSVRPGVVALKQIAGLSTGAVSAGQVGFQLAPRINAAGRVDCALKIVELLTTESSEIALRIAHELDENNRERRLIEGEVLKHALIQAEACMNRGSCYSLVLGGEGWHPGVLGIIASRIVERFYRPTVIIGFTAAEGKGSGRSIRGFHMFEGFRRCADLLLKFGGHEYAGGLSIRADKLECFAEAFEQVARETLTHRDLVPVVDLDVELSFSQIDVSLMRELEVLKPFGVGNAEPVFVTRGVEVCERTDFSAGARFRFRHTGRNLGGVVFGAPEEFPVICGETVDLAYRLTEREWNGTSGIELRIVDVRSAVAGIA